MVKIIRSREFYTKFVFIFLVLALFFVSAAAFLLWQKTQKFEPAVYYYVPAGMSFLYNQEDLEEFGIEDYIRERVTIEKNKLIEKKRSFIYLNLKEMKLILYKEGEIFKIFPIQSKGREGSWWETAPGTYFVGDKLLNHFSSVSRVWMPYAVQFYGNFFIHGWPYYTGGTPLASGPSGGCVRLRTIDVVVVFEFAERGMPVLVFEEKVLPPLPALQMIDPKVLLPEIKSQGLLVADLETGEIIINKEMDSEIYASPVIGGMLALAASEVVNLEKRIVARQWMFEGFKEGLIVPGRSYRAYDLLYPLLRQSSRESALVLSRFLTPEYFVTLMNIKAKAIGMNNTNFVDIAGVSRENTTTLYDVARMARYIKDYRSFIFETSNPNENFFIEKENIIGVLAGQRKDEKETVFTIWKMKTLDNVQRIIFIGLIDSLNARQDIEDILLWLNRAFGLK